MSRPRLLDLFCGQGGAGMGYHRAGFDVVGVDVKLQPHYPFAFVQTDALEYLAAHGREYAAIHASPPCQAYTPLRHRTGSVYPDLVAPAREALAALELPWVIENVPGAPLRRPMRLCGTQFGLRAGERWLRRHRLFESNVFLRPPLISCSCRGRAIGGVYGHGGGGPATRGFKFVRAEAREAMGIDWMPVAGLAQAIPPAYTEFIGRQLLAALTMQGRAA